VALPLYPHFSSATTGSSFKDLDRALGDHPGLEVTRVTDFHDHPLYIEALARTVRRGLDDLEREPAPRSRGGVIPGDSPADPVVVFSAHSLPRRLVERGDPYQRQVETTVRRVTRHLGLVGDRWDLGYQSRSGPVRWIEPDVLDVVARLAKQGVRRLLVVPVSFVSDHIETLHEIDIEMREHALSNGVTQFGRAPALNEEQSFIDALTHITLQACQTPPTTDR
jgi:ferrochelatase